MLDFGFDLQLLARDCVFVLAAFLLALPIGWERGRGPHSVGFRTLPIVSMASCGFALIISETASADNEAQARVLQGVITGIGFIGGGAIIKQGRDVKGLVTAASIWNAGAIGVAVGLGRLNIAILLSFINLIGLWLLAYLDVDDDEKENQSR
ncbi:MgtC/SapB family protein [Chelativorans salis]|uniref:Protein MgtC n=1 Tax=Chelativorans salis TaxID=2978478 RepID=A0ABT2LK99_9HYPH|nr:MgtC/SapB family protein [Chelativorans sp. EGI FJ00035]MCT7374098.1 MgtC/SapB family protein [Chelativorans sp. EGI FJ00035]